MNAKKGCPQLSSSGKSATARRRYSRRRDVFAHLSMLIEDSRQRSTDQQGTALRQLGADNDKRVSEFQDCGEARHLHSLSQPYSPRHVFSATYVTRSRPPSRNQGIAPTASYRLGWDG